MKVFDFDNTIYRGESAVDLFFFMLRGNKRLLRFVPSIVFNTIKYKLCLVEKNKMEAAVNDLMKAIIRSREELLRITEEFWKVNAHKLNRGIIRYMSPEDVIVTAAPRFLIEGIGEYLPTRNIVCSETDLDRKCVTWFNFGDNKVRRYSELYGGRTVSCFFTDSYNDRAMMAISRKVFLVRRGRIKRKLKG